MAAKLYTIGHMEQRILWLKAACSFGSLLLGHTCLCCKEAMAYTRTQLSA